MPFSELNHFQKSAPIPNKIDMQTRTDCGFSLLPGLVLMKNHPSGFSLMKPKPIIFFIWDYFGIAQKMAFI